MGKQFLRLTNKPNCLFSKVFKGRYFGNTDPLDHPKSYPSSYGWQSICSARSLVKNGLIKRVETWQSISIWNDPWVPAPRPSSALRTNHNQFLNHSLTLEHLINSVDHSWNVNILNAYIHLEDVKIIKGMAISRNSRHDVYGWMFTEFGKYSIKSGYKTEYLHPDKGPGIIFMDQTPNPFWPFHGNCSVLRN